MTDVADAVGPPGRPSDRHRPPPRGRPLHWLGVVVVVLLVCSATASAHGGVDGGTPQTVAVVVGLPVVGGALGGGIAVRSRWLAAFVERRQSQRLPGLLLVVLGGTFVLAALGQGYPIGISGVAVGGGVATWVARRGPDSEASGSVHAHLTLGAVCGHRLVEGVVLGALYATGAVLGLVGTVVLAVHTAVETAAVGGLYATTPRRRRAVAVVVLVQAWYVVGAVVGLGVAVSIPAVVRALALAIAGGTLVVVGAAEADRSVTAGESVVTDRPP